MKLPTEQVIADAETAALYLRTLVSNGVPLMAAVSLAGSYVLAGRCSDAAKERPREPWEGEPPT